MNIVDTGLEAGLKMKWKIAINNFCRSFNSKWMSLQRLRNTTFWKRVMSAIDTPQPTSPVPLSPTLISPELPPREATPSEQQPQEPPRKRRRKAGNKQGFVKPENRNADLFTKADWTIDGPYRRVPPYFFVFSLHKLVILTIDILDLGEGTLA